jgi:hypothetical protein
VNAIRDGKHNHCNRFSLRRDCLTDVNGADGGGRRLGIKMSLKSIIEWLAGAKPA